MLNASKVAFLRIEAVVIYQLSSLELRYCREKSGAVQLGADHLSTLHSKNNLVVLYLDQEDFDRAAPLCKEVLDAYTAKLGADQPRTLAAKTNLASMYFQQRK